MRRGQAGEDLRVHTLGGDWRLSPVAPSDFIDNGIREVLTVRLRSGRQLTATPNHPLLTVDGWAPIDTLAVGSRVAVPRRLHINAGSTPYAPGPSEHPDSLVALVGLLLGDGNLTNASPVLSVSDPRSPRMPRAGPRSSASVRSPPPSGVLATSPVPPARTLSSGLESEATGTPRRCDSARLEARPTR